MTCSIIIPAYKHAEYLADAIESALAQTIRCEVIVINDGSPDNCGEIAKHYPVKVINQVNKGLSAARNTGIMNATGDYILPLDSDDYLAENCVEKLLQIAEATKADVVSASFKTFGKDSGLIILMPSPSIEDFKQGNRIGYCSLIKRSALLEVGGYNPKMIFGAEDYDLWFDLLKRGKLFVTTTEVLWYYRTKESSMWTETKTHEKEYRDQIKVNHPEIDFPW